LSSTLSKSELLLLWLLLLLQQAAAARLRLVWGKWTHRDAAVQAAPGIPAILAAPESIS
jgi:hypothetical protein